MEQKHKQETTEDNVVVISDLHFDNWPRCSPTKDFRMRTQPMMLAKRLTQVMKEYHTNELYILGDIINQWSASPQIMGVLVDFYKKLIDDNPDIFIGYIVGQHDIRLYDDYAEDNSYVHLVARMFPHNVHYMHDKYINHEQSGTKFYFSSFNRQQIIYPKEFVNVFLSHITFGFVDVDTNCADLIVAGDIHDFYDLGNCHSVGLPYQLYSHQPKDGVIGIIHCKGHESTFERIKSDTAEFEFLKLDPIVRRKLDKGEAAVDTPDDLKLNSSDIMKMIEEEVRKHNVEDIHKEIPMNALPAPVNFKFQLQRLIIDNVRSIDHLELDLKNLTGVNYVSGATGSGKSSIFYSLITALVGADREELVRKTNKVTGKPLRLQLWLEYEGHQYYIDRSVKETRLTIDGKLEPLGKRDSQKRILELLPFANYWRYFYIQANQHYFDSINKTELMRVLFNLKIFDYLFLESKNLLKTNNANLKRTREDLIAKSAANELIRKNIDEHQQELEKFKDLTINAEEVDSKIQEDRQIQSKIEAYNIQLQTQQKAAERIKGILANIDQLPTQTSQEELQKERDKLQHNIQEAADNNLAYDRLAGKILTCETNIKVLKSVKVSTCPYCGKVLKGQDEQKIKEVEEELKQYQEELAAKAKIDVADLRIRIGEINAKLTEYEKYKKSVQEQKEVDLKIAELLNSINEMQTCVTRLYKENEVDNREAFINKMMELKVQISKRDHLRQELDKNNKLLQSNEVIITQLKEEIAKLEKHSEQIIKYNELFNIQELSSIPYSILSKLVKYLNTKWVKFESSMDGENFNITASIQVGDQTIAYEEASDGQKNYLDMFILIRITRFLSGEDKLGLIIMDEPLVNLDASYIEDASQLIPEISASTIFISSHTKFDGYDRVIQVTQEPNGLSKVDLK